MSFFVSSEIEVSSPGAQAPSDPKFADLSLTQSDASKPKVSAHSELDARTSILKRISAVSLEAKSPAEIKEMMAAQGILSRHDFKKISHYKKDVALCNGGKMYAVYESRDEVVSFYNTNTKKPFLKMSALCGIDGLDIDGLIDKSCDDYHPLREDYVLMKAKRERLLTLDNSDHRIDEEVDSFIIYSLKNKTMTDVRPLELRQYIRDSLSRHQNDVTDCKVLCQEPAYSYEGEPQGRKNFVFTITLYLFNKFSGEFFEQRTFVCSYNLETQTSKVLHSFPFVLAHLVLNQDDQIAAYLKVGSDNDFDQETVMYELCEMQDGHPEIIWKGLIKSLDECLYDKNDPESPYFLEGDMTSGINEPVLRSLRSNQIIPLLPDAERQKVQSERKGFQLNPKNLRDLISYGTSYDEPTLHIKLPNGSFEAIKASMIQQSSLFQDRDFLMHFVQMYDVKKPSILDFSTKTLDQFFLLSPPSEKAPVKFELIYSKHALDDLVPEIRAKCSLPQSFTFKARDALEIQGYLTLPVNKEAKNLPAILMVHGGPALRDKLRLTPKVQAWASRGFAVVQINFRGSSGFGEKFEEVGYGEWNGKMTDDLIDGLTFLINRGVLNPEKIVAYGGSYGGFAVASCLTRYPDFFTCGIALNGLYDLIEEVKGFDSEKQRIQHSKKYGVTILDDNSVSETDLEKLQQISPYYALDQLKKPLLIISAGADDICDPGQSHALAEQAEALGKSILHIEFDDAGHHFETVESNASQLSNLEFGLCENFVSRYLPEIFAEPVSADFENEKTAHIIRSTL